MSRPVTLLTWIRARRHARWALAGYSALVVGQAMALSLAPGPILAFLTTPEKLLWMVVGMASIFAVAWQAERLVDLRPLPAAEQAALLQREGDARVRALGLEVPLLRGDVMDLMVERWRAIP